MPSISHVKLGLYALLLALISMAQAAAPDTLQFRLGTATPGGGFQLFGDNLVAVLNDASPEVRIQAVATRGSRHNLELLEQGELDLGLVEGNAARQALDGVGRPRSALQVLAVMYPNPGMFVVRADSDHRTIADLKGRPVAFGTSASGLRLLLNDVLTGLGLSPSEDFQPIILEKAADGPRMVLDGSAEALWGAGIGWPGFARVAESDAGARFIAPSAAEQERILARHPHLRRMTVPAGTYRGQDQPVDSVGLWSLILIRPEVPASAAYELAAALHAIEPALAERLPQARFTTAANTVREVPVERLHPGAAQYYRAQGLLVD